MRTWAEISRGTIAENYRAIQKAVGKDVAVAGVVKANAYGHGALAVARVLVDAGARWLAVSNAAEGAALRQAGFGERILVMGGVLACERDTIFAAGLTPVAHSLEELLEWDALGRALAVHLKVDTGMARLGTRASPERILEAAGRLRKIHLEGLMSHFASPDDFAASQEQVRRLEQVLASVRPEIVHISSSFALTNRLASAHYNMVRPGIALYAGALTWKARIVGIKDLPMGAAVGYGARFQAAHAMRTAVIAAGYADGVPRSLTNRGAVMVDGQTAPIVGAVSMDLTTVDVTGIAAARLGAEVEIVGRQMAAEDVAHAAGTISYEIFTGIGNRVARVYRD